MLRSLRPPVRRRPFFPMPHEVSPPSGGPAGNDNAVLSRRSFLRTTALASSAIAFPAIVRGADGGTPPTDRLNVAIVGVGGQGRSSVGSFKGENLVAFCDVDDRRATQTYQEFPDVPRFKDYRVMLDTLGSQIDAVAVCTPDHMHAPIALLAMSMGKHVFVEKPMAHTVAECGRMARMAREKRVKTQMGNQGHAFDGTRVLKEWVDAGVLGEVREVFSWTNRPIWPQGMKAPEHKEGPPAVPPELDWNLWLGVAADRPYDPGYLPFNWRGWWDFGTGALGDIACHSMDAAFYALRLGNPTAIEALSTPVNDVSAPSASVIHYDFPARSNLPALRYTWTDGRISPAFPPGFEEGRGLGESGTLLVGSRATVLLGMYAESIRIVPETRMRELAPSLPAKTLPRVEGGHFQEFIRACKGGPEAGSNFEYASRLTEMVLLGNAAVRTRRRLEWSESERRFTNHEPANAFLDKQYRPGWTV